MLMGHVYRQLTAAECAEEIRAICGDDPGEPLTDYQAEPPQKSETPMQGDPL